MDLINNKSKIAKGLNTDPKKCQEYLDILNKIK